MRLRQDGGLDEFLELIDRVRDYRVLVVGDAIIDEYQYVLPMHKTPKENMIATRYQDRELFAGGVFAAANHVASFCKQVDIVTCLGDVDSHEGLIRQSLRPNVGLRTFTRAGAPTTLKRRFVDPSYMRKLFEVYFMNDEPLTSDVQGEVDRTIAEMAPEYDVVIAADFGHGIISKSSIEALTKNARFLAVNTQSNSANLGFNLITRLRPRRLHLHRSAGGPARCQRPDVGCRRYRAPVDRGEGRLLKNHRDARQARLRDA